MRVRDENYRYEIHAPGSYSASRIGHGPEPMTPEILQAIETDVANQKQKRGLT